jgi:hypothetical protein
VSGLQKDFESSVKADFARVPVPPEGAEGEPFARPQAAPAATQEDVAALVFLEPGAMTKTIPLEYGFVFGGVEYRSVTARRLSYAEVARVYERAKDAEGEVKLIEFYAEMTGLRAAVIRGLEGGDGHAVIEGCHPFLPRQLRTVGSPSTSQSGGA